MSNVRPLVLPVVEALLQTPPWVEAARQPSVETLVDRLTGQNRAGAGRSDGRGAEANDNGVDDLGESSEGSVSRLPPPPSLGTLVPGGRSNPPPANDGASALGDERLDAFASAAVELAIARASTLATVEGQLLDLAIEIASAIIEREVEADHELHGTLARAALRTLGDCTRATLRTSPEAHSAVTEYIGGERLEIGGVRVEVVSDGSIPGLGCVVDAEHVRVDATVTERLRAVRLAFEDERRRRLGGLE